MSVDKLQEKIRKMKNPLILDLGVLPEHIPPQLLEQTGNYSEAYGVFCKELLAGLKAHVPAVRLHFGEFALMGGLGVEILRDVLSHAKAQGYYVLLDGIDTLSPISAERNAHWLFGEGVYWEFDGLILSAYAGSDVMRPYIDRMEASGKDLFVVARTSNKTAIEIQDLLSGSRLAHMAMADIVNRYAPPFVGKCGYSSVGLVAGASSAESLRTLRPKFKNLFFLLDGFDYPNANAKNCSFAFDKLGHGAAACAGTSITAAWQEEKEPEDYVACAVRSAERLKRNLGRYITVL